MRGKETKTALVLFSYKKTGKKTVFFSKTRMFPTPSSPFCGGSDVRVDHSLFLLSCCCFLRSPRRRTCRLRSKQNSFFQLRLQYFWTMWKRVEKRPTRGVRVILRISGNLCLNALSLDLRSLEKHVFKFRSALVIWSQGCIFHVQEQMFESLELIEGVMCLSHRCCAPS